MLYRLLADLVLILHLVFIAFALFGGLLALWRKWLPLVHLPAAVWIAAIEFQGWICPLTPLENRLRNAGGEAGYAGSFIEHYLLSLIYPPGLTREIQILLGLLAILINLGIYILVIHRLRKPSTAHQTC